MIERAGTVALCGVFVATAAALATLLLAHSVEIGPDAAVFLNGALAVGALLLVAAGALFVLGH